MMKKSKDNKRVLILTPNYPSEERKYSNAFIHRRAKLYLESNIDVLVAIPGNKDTRYVYEDVSVQIMNPHSLRMALESGLFDKLFIHFLEFGIIRKLLRIKPSIPIVVFVHGYEALSWRRRIFKFNSIRFFGYIIKNIIQLHYFRLFKKTMKAKYVFVSNWMKMQAENDLGVEFDDFEIIPNVIDDKLFCYRKKNEEHRYKVLSIRPYDTKKYANDITIKSILKFASSNPELFSRFKFSLYGDGILFDKLTYPLKNFENVDINKRFLSQSEIADLHKDYGVFICVTRQDAQGVSMCEAMSSGLIPITSNNTAIPEFVEDRIDGFLTNNQPERIVDCLVTLSQNPDMFLEMSSNAAKNIRVKCGISSSVKEEIRIIEE
ncbi:MAG: hypothetical protein Tsb0034_02640 [Ekhidna sp.]